MLRIFEILTYPALTGILKKDKIEKNRNDFCKRSVLKLH